MKLRCTVWDSTIVGIVALLALAVVAPVAGQDVDAAEHNDETQPLQPVSEAPIKLVHVLNPGEREYLSPNLIGVQNIAMTYLPLTMTFINIIDAFREIVNGVRYEILLNAIDTQAEDADIICRLVILEKPWLRTEWGDKVRELQNSNCTNEENNLTDPMAKNRALNDKYERNALFNGGTRNELSTHEMEKLAAQIMPHSTGSAGKNTKPITTTSRTTTTTTTPITESIESAVDAATPVPAADEEMDLEPTGEPKELSDDEKKWLDDILSVGALNFEKSLQQNSDNNDDVTAVDNLATADEGINNRQQATAQKNKVVLEDEQRAVRDTEKFEASHVRSKRSYNAIVGGTSPLDKSDAEQRLRETLTELAGGDGPNYKLGKVHSSTTQVVAGSLTKFDADLIDQYGKTIRCNITIWSRSWLPNGNEVTFKCPDQETVNKRYSRSVEYVEKKSHKKHAHHSYEKTEHLFNKFQVKFNKRYHSTMERQMRLRIFKQNIKTIEELNRNEMGSAKYGITEFADMTTTEYKQRTGLWQRAADKPSKNAKAEIPDIELPKDFDWREKGVISQVKNQGSCGSCWAFSVTGNIEGLQAVKSGNLQEYSEQELLDCDTIDSACNGGLPDNAYEAIQKIGGLELESEYPYEGRKNQCHFNKTLSRVQLKGAIDLPKNETAMAQWLIANGPISIGINANAMQFYRGGVSHPWRPLCSHSNLDHGVLIVGFGVSDYPMFKKTLPYWIVKNSWGTKWGEQGYYRVYRGDNTCGVSEMPTSGVLA